MHTNIFLDHITPANFKGYVTNISHKCGLLQFRIVRYLLGINLKNITDLFINQIEKNINFDNKIEKDFNFLITQVFKIKQPERYLNVFDRLRKNYSLNAENLQQLPILPSDVLNQIFKQLPLKSKLQTRLVCYQFNELINPEISSEKVNGLLKKTITAFWHYTNQAYFNELLNLLAKEGCLTKKLDLSFNEGVYANHSIDLKQKNLVTILNAIYSYCPYLVEITLPRTVTNDELKIVGKFEKLQTLNLAHCTLITDAGLLSLINLKKLKSLNLTACSHVTGSAFEQLAQHLNLTTLYVHGCINLLNSALPGMSTFKSLKRLYMGACRRLTGNYLELVSQKLTFLTVLDVSLNTEMNQNISFIANFKNLKTLSLAACQGIQSLDLLTQLEKLEKLDLGMCKFSDEVDLNSIRSMPSLKLEKCRFPK